MASQRLNSSWEPEVRGTCSEGCGPRPLRYYGRTDPLLHREQDFSARTGKNGAVASTIRPAPVLDGAEALDDFDSLYRAFGDRLTRFCRAQVGPAGDPEDAAQEALMKAWASRDRFDASRPLWPWLATIARNVCIDQQRHAAVARARLQPAELSPLGPEDLAMGQAHRGLVRDAIQELTPGAREVLLLHFVDELGYAEIAARQRRSQGAIRTAVTRARSDLRRRVELLARARGAWPLAGLTGGIAPIRVKRFGRLRAAAQRRTADVTMRTSGTVENLAQCAEGFSARVVVGGMLAVAALVQQGVTDDPGRNPALVEVREATADWGTAAKLDRPHDATPDGGVGAPSTATPVPADVAMDASRLAPTALPTGVGAIGTPTHLVDEGLHLAPPVTAPAVPEIDASPSPTTPPPPVAPEQPVEPAAPAVPTPDEIDPPDIDPPTP